MTRVLWIVVALAACGKKPDATAQGGSNGSGSAAKPTAGDEPKTPPPPPTIKTGKGDCKTEYAPRPTRDPNPMCKIAGGTFAMADYAKGSVPVKLSPYFIDQFEVTNAQVAHYLNATKAEDCSAPKTERDPCFRIGTGSQSDFYNTNFIVKTADGSYTVMPGLERVAFGNVSRQGAMEYCAWAGKMLPTEAQWEFAARHDPATNKDHVYPWGDEFDGTRARCIRDHCPLPAAPADVRADNQPVPVGTFDGTGGFGDGRSPWGVFEMAGNVSEVIADCVGQPTCTGDPCTDPAPRGPRNGTCEPIARGGGINGPRQLRATDSGTRILDGFRCAKPGG